MSGTKTSEYRYWAYISYSHRDNLRTRGTSDGHIQWANWLQEQLETFRIPDSCRDRTTPTGEPMPERFFPATFVDENELPASADLGAAIHRALDCSRFLILIASPRSAKSRFVNEEVRYFRQIGRGDRIFTLIVDGHPLSSLRPEAGRTASDECFCPALIHPLRPDGSLDETRLLEPIAADVRTGNNLPRELRVSDLKQVEFRNVMDTARLKLIAGLMGVDLGSLLQRDKKLHEENHRVSELMREIEALRLENSRLKELASIESSERQVQNSKPRRWTVFISAKSEDYALARQVFEFLKLHRINAFLSDKSLLHTGNSDYRKEIDYALEQVNHMVVVTSSRENVDAPWVEAEWGFFVNEKRSGGKQGNLVTVIAGGVRPRNLPPSLRYFEALTLDDAGLQKLLSYVGS